MAESEAFTIGASAECTDGSCGRLTQVVVDPIRRQVTHLIIEPEHRAGLGRLVPVEWAQADGDVVRIQASRSEFEDLEIAEEIRFLPGSEGLGDYGPDEVWLWPLFGGNFTLPVTHDSLPVGEVAIRRGEQVRAVDGVVGTVDGLVVDSGDQRVTHVVLAEGHAFGRKEVAIAVGAVEGIDDEGVRVSLSKEEIAELPPVDFTRH